jgi:HTH-type transcriptional regulator/antitoxin HigA
MKTITPGPAVERDYLNLVRRFPLRPIRSRAEHRLGVAIVTELAASGDEQLTQGQADYAAALAHFVAEYEQERLLAQLGRATPLEVLSSLMEERGMSPADLGALLGSRPVATMILKEQRELSKTHIRALAAYFAVSPSLFL